MGLYHCVIHLSSQNLVVLHHRIWLVRRMGEQEGDSGGEGSAMRGLFWEDNSESWGKLRT
jgi:hypothetical protein